eukprot:scaffold60592_cov40-Prasinocladus_malaysianus.AAC.2
MTATGPSTADGTTPVVDITVDNDSDPSYTKAPNRPGLLTALTSTFRDLNLDVAKAVVDKGKNGKVEDVFYVTDLGGDKVTDTQDVNNLKILQWLVQMARWLISLYVAADTYIRNDVLSIQESYSLLAA